MNELVVYQASSTSLNGEGEYSSEDVEISRHPMEFQAKLPTGNPFAP
jgi:hypothetical protein